MKFPYLINAKIYSSLKRQALSIPEDNWQYVGSGYYVAEKRCHLDKWEHDRIFIFIHHEKLIEPKNKDQMSLKGLGAIYSYQAIVANLTGGTSLNYLYNQSLETELTPVIRFANQLKRHQYSILNYALYPIHTSKFEETNNKIKEIKRSAYGFHDNRYFALKIKQAFPGNI